MNNTTSFSLTHSEFLQQSAAYQELLIECAKPQPLEPGSRARLFRSLNAVFALDDSEALNGLLQAGLPVQVAFNYGADWRDPHNLGAMAVEHNAVRCLTALVAQGLDVVNTSLNKDLGSNLWLTVEKLAPACFDFILTQKNNEITAKDTSQYGQYLLVGILEKIYNHNTQEGATLLARLFETKIAWSAFTRKEFAFERVCIDDRHSVLDFMLAQDVNHEQALIPLLMYSARENPLRLKKIFEFLETYNDPESQSVVDKYKETLHFMLEKNYLNKNVKVLSSGAQEKKTEQKSGYKI